MPDAFSRFQSGLESPATNLAFVTPDDAADMTHACRALNVATSGVVRVTTVGGDTGDLFIAAGLPFPIRALRVHATGTTATGIMALR